MASLAAPEGEGEPLTLRNHEEEPLVLEVVPQDRIGLVRDDDLDARVVVRQPANPPADALLDHVQFVTIVDGGMICDAKEGSRGRMATTWRKGALAILRPVTRLNRSAGSFAYLRQIQKLHTSQRAGGKPRWQLALFALGGADLDNLRFRPYRPFAVPS